MKAKKGKSPDPKDLPKLGKYSYGLALLSLIMMVFISFLLGA